VYVYICYSKEPQRSGQALEAETESWRFWTQKTPHQRTCSAQSRPKCFAC